MPVVSIRDREIDPNANPPGGIGEVYELLTALRITLQNAVLKHYRVVAPHLSVPPTFLQISEWLENGEILILLDRPVSTAYRRVLTKQKWRVDFPVAGPRTRRGWNHVYREVWHPSIMD